MRIRTVIRKSLKWGGAALVVGLATAWIGSGWWYVVSPTYLVSPTFGSHQFALGLGRLSWLTGSSTSALDAEWYTRDCSKFPFFWWFGFTRSVTRAAFYIPVWCFLLPALVAVWMAWRADGRARRYALLHECGRCGYARAGLAAGAVCPECGAAPVLAAGAAKV